MRADEAHIHHKEGAGAVPVSAHRHAPVKLSVPGSACCLRRRRGSGEAAAGGAPAVRGCGGGWFRRGLACGPEDLQPGARHCKLHLIG